MVMSTLFYSSAKVDTAIGSIDFDTHTFKGMLVTDAYTPAAAHDFRDDVTSEVSGTGYTAGGATLASMTVILSGTEARIDCADPSWPSATITARGMVIYRSVGSAATDRLVCALLFTGGVDVTSTNGTFTVAIDATGFAAFQ